MASAKPLRLDSFVGSSIIFCQITCPEWQLKQKLGYDRIDGFVIKAFMDCLKSKLDCIMEFITYICYFHNERSILWRVSIWMSDWCDEAQKWSKWSKEKVVPPSRTVLLVQR